MRQSKYWLLLVAVLFIGGCIGSSSTAPPDTVLDQQPTIQELADQLPALPPDKAVDAVFTTELLGWQWENKSANAIDEGTNLNLVSGLNEMSWGIWHFNTVADLQDVQAVIDVSAGDEVYLAVSDYSSGSWEFDGPLSGGKTLALDSVRNKSVLGNFYIAVITVGGSSALVYKHVLNAESDWFITTVDNSGFAKETSMKIVNGRPAIAYYDNGINQVKFARAVDEFGEFWPSPVLATAVVSIYRAPSLEIVNGHPAISFARQVFLIGEESLNFVRAQDISGEVWGTMKQVEYYGSDGDFEISDTSLAVVSGNPAICFTGFWGLEYVRSSDANGQDWSSAITLAGNSEADHNCSIVVENGNPIISFENTSAGKLNIIGATDADGTNWNPPQIVAAGMGDGNNAFSSGALVNGSLAMSYYDNTANLLKFARWEFMAAEWEHHTVDIPQDIIQHTNLQVINGNPAISYYDHIAGALKYTRAFDNKGTLWPEPVIVDSLHVTGVYSSMVEIDGKPAISYTNNLGELKYAYEVGP